MNDDSKWKDRFIWLASQHYIEPEATFRLGLSDCEDSDTYIKELIAAIDKKLKKKTD